MWDVHTGAGMRKTNVSDYERCGANDGNCLWRGEDACAEEDVDREMVSQKQHAHLFAGQLPS